MQEKPHIIKHRAIGILRIHQCGRIAWLALNGVYHSKHQHYRYQILS